MKFPLDITGDDLVAALSTESDPLNLQVMICEAGRIVDRLAKFNALLDGDIETWTRVVTARDATIELRVDNVMSEARQQTTVLRHLLAEIARQRGNPANPGADDDDGLDGL